MIRFLLISSCRLSLHTQGGELCSSNTDSFSHFLCRSALASASCSLWTVPVWDHVCLHSFLECAADENPSLELEELRWRRRDGGGDSGVSCRKMETPTLALGSYQDTSREVGLRTGLGCVAYFPCKCALFSVAPEKFSLLWRRCYGFLLEDFPNPLLTECLVGHQAKHALSRNY